MGGEGAAVVGHDGAGDRQAEARARCRVPAAGGVDAVEPVEDRLELVGWDALAGVSDLDDGRAARAGCAVQVDLAAGRGVPQRVVEQVAQYLLDAVRVDRDGAADAAVSTREGDFGGPVASLGCPHHPQL